MRETLLVTGALIPDLSQEPENIFQAPGTGEEIDRSQFKDRRQCLSFCIAALDRKEGVMRFERHIHACPASKMPQGCANCPDRQCAICTRFLLISPDLAFGYARLARHQSFAPGAEMSQGHGFHTSISVVAKGVAMISCLLEDGRRHVVAFRYPGELLSLAGMVATDGIITALTPIRVARVDADQADRFVAEHPLAAKSLTGLASDHMAQMVDHMVLLGRLDALERVAAFLVDCADRVGKAQPDGIALALPMSRSEIADHLGLNTETVSRQFARLKQDGLVRLESPSRLLIPDLAALCGRAPALFPQVRAS